MHEVMEAHEGHGGHEGNPLTIRVAVTLSILAVFVAIATLLGHRAATEELILQSKSTDQWAFFQAKNIRLHEMQGVADMLGTLTTLDKDKAEAVQEKYVKEIERYEKEKGEASEQAKEFEQEKEVASRRADRFDAGEVLLEIALIICSLTLLTGKKLFWASGIVIGLIGLCVASSGFFLH